MKFLSPLALSFVFAIAFHSPASAQDTEASYIEKHAPPGISATFYACVNKANTNVVAAGACLTTEHDYQDKRLNVAYKKLLGALNQKERPMLVAAERAWISLQDKDGSLEAALYGDDQIYSMQQDQNEIFRICERANALERYLDIVKNK